LARELFDYPGIVSKRLDVAFELFDFDVQSIDAFGCGLMSGEREFKFASAAKVKLNA
jgi:hypothetical protein